MADQMPGKNCGTCRFMRAVHGGHQCHRNPPQAFFIPASGSNHFGQVIPASTISDWPPTTLDRDCGEWKSAEAGAGVVELVPEAATSFRPLL